MELERAVELIKAAIHALRSYEYGNSDSTLARLTADRLEKELEEEDGS